jgi:Cu-processing system ATP-binding protein
MIRYESFTKHFGAVRAITGLELAVGAGETVALVGPNGSGKTTSIKAALGLVRPTEGRVWVDGKDVQRDGVGARAALGYLPQRLSFPHGSTAREALRFYARLRRADSGAIDGLLERVALSDAADREVDGYSGGMRQRLGLAIALLGAPRALILDEPTAALDPTGSLMVRDVVQEIRAEGTTVLLSSHDLAEVAALADRVAVFNGGRLAALFDNPGSVAALETAYRRATAGAVRYAA